MMPAGCAKLFDYSAAHITPEDIIAFAPADPGYADYVHVFTGILSTRQLPVEANFDVKETIGLTRWVDADEESDPDRFRRFRIFTNAVALSLCVDGKARGAILPENYTAISLLDDAYALKDVALLRLLHPAFEEFYEFTVKDVPEESLFVLLGLLLVAIQLHAPISELNQLADRLIEEEGKINTFGSNDFLLCCTCFGQLHEKWKWHVDTLVQPVTPSLALLREAILNG